ncbi:MAG: prolipoprotein diacylglyceryl transferase [Phycisphaerae bacterium]
MRPIFFRLPLPGTDHAVTLYAYGAMICLGFLAAIWVAAWRARTERQNPEVIYNAGLLSFLGGLFGGRLFYIVQYHTQFFSVWDLLKIWEGGLVYYGGLLLAAAAVIGYLRLARRPVLYWLDILAPSLALGLAMGRMGCFLNGCCYGDVSQLPWAFAWPVGAIPWSHYADAFLASAQAASPLVAGAGAAAPLGAMAGAIVTAWHAPAIHPSQLYALVNALALFVLLHLWFRHKRRHGQIFFTFILLYGASRFLLEFVRADEAEVYFLGLPTLLEGLGWPEAAGRLGGLTISQNVAAWMFAAAAGTLVWLGRSPSPLLRADYQPPPDPSPGDTRPKKGKRR